MSEQLTVKPWKLGPNLLTDRVASQGLWACPRLLVWHIQLELADKKKVDSAGGALWKAVSGTHRARTAAARSMGLSGLCLRVRAAAGTGGRCGWHAAPVPRRRAPAAANLAMLKMRLWAPLCADTHGRLHNRAGSAVRPQALGAGRQEVSEEEAAMYLRFGNLIGDSPEETADVLAQRGGAAAAAATAIRGFVPRRAATHRASRVMRRLRTAAHLSVRARGRQAPARQAPASARSSARSSACGTQHLPARQVGVLPGLRAVSGVPAHAATVAAGCAARKRRMPGWRPWSRACGGPRPRRAARRRTRRWTAQRPRRAALPLPERPAARAQRAAGHPGLLPVRAGRQGAGPIWPRSWSRTGWLVRPDSTHAA